MNSSTGDTDPFGPQPAKKRMGWLKLHSGDRNDRRLGSLTDEQFRVWFNLLCLANEQEERGTVVGYEEDTDLLALEVANGDTERLRDTIARLTKLRIVGIEDGAIVFLDWARQQQGGMKPSDLPEATRERQQRKRERDRETQSNTVTPLSRPVTPPFTPDHAPSHPVTPREEKRRSEQSRGDQRESRCAQARGDGTPAPDLLPLSPEMIAWAEEHAPGVDLHGETARFLDYHRAKGTIFRDWYAAWRSWLTSPYAKPKSRPGTRDTASGGTGAPLPRKTANNIRALGAIRDEG